MPFMRSTGRRRRPQPDPRPMTCFKVATRPAGVRNGVHAFAWRDSIERVDTDRRKPKDGGR